MESSSSVVEFEIRRATLGDAAVIAGLLRSLRLFEHINGESPVETSARVLRHLELALADESHLVLVALDHAGALAGYCAVHWVPYLLLRGPEGYVSELFVSDAFRGKGIGGRLLRQVRNEARRRGCARLMLLNIRSRESYQRQFYAKQGWVERSDAANFILPIEGGAG